MTNYIDDDVRTEHGSPRVKFFNTNDVRRDSGSRAGIVGLGCSDITVYLGGVRALYNVDIQITVGNIVAIIGPNGAGKTTLLDVLSGFLTPTTGTVTVDGRNVTDWAPDRRARLGLHRTFQGSRLFGGLSVYENIISGALAIGNPRKLAEQRCDRLLEQLDLSFIKRARCQELPPGLTQRVVLARALSTEPRYLLLDEPAAGLSKAETKECKEILWLARQSGTAILIIEHDMAFIEATCQYVHVLVEGEITFSGGTEDVFANASVQNAYLGTTKVNDS